MTNDTTPTKTCTKCNETFPVTSAYFHRDKSNKDGLCSQCKKCCAERHYQYRQGHQEQIAERTRHYYEAHQERITERLRQYRQAHREQEAERARQYRQAHREQNAEYQRQYRQAHQEQEAERTRQYRQAHQKKITERNRISNSRYRAHKRDLPDTFTLGQWLQCLTYFNHCCLVCDNQLRDLFGDIEPHADHWIPLAADECPGTIAQNMICLCNTCNLSKGATMPDIWLERKYGTRKAAQISIRIETYFEWATQ